MESAPIGNILKYKLQITASGFDMSTDRFDIIVSCSGKELVLTQADVLADLDDNYYIVIDTSVFRSGVLRAKTIAYINDPDCPGGTRTEVDVHELKRLIHA